MSRRPEVRARRDRGASSVELAIVAPLVIILTMLFVQTAIWFHARQVAQTAVDQGARASRAFGGSDAEGVQTAERFFDLAGGPRVTEGTVQITAGRTAETVSMRLKTNCVSVIPGARLPVEAVAGGPIERFVLPGGA